MNLEKCIRSIPDFPKKGILLAIQGTMDMNVKKIQRNVVIKNEKKAFVGLYLFFLKNKTVKTTITRNKKIIFITRRELYKVFNGG